MKYIFIGILILAVPLVWLGVYSGSIERQAKETLRRELADVLKAPIESKFHSGAIGEGNDSWMEYHFKFGVSASRPTTLSHNGIGAIQQVSFDSLSEYKLNSPVVVWDALPLLFLHDTLYHIEGKREKEFEK